MSISSTQAPPESDRRPLVATQPPALQLLHDYADVVSRRSSSALENTALRSRSYSARELLAYLATGGAARLDEVVTRPSLATDHRWLASLGRVVALQNLTPDDQAVGIELLREAVPGLPERDARPYRKLLAELLFAREDYVGAREVIQRSKFLKETGYNYLRMDLANPQTASPFADEEEWVHRFRRRFERAQLIKPVLRTDVTGFERLAAPDDLPTVDGPLVSVVMTTFKPELRYVMHAATSVLRQTWTNVELIVVDDASPAEYGDVLDALAALDPRVRVLRMPTNGGTYLARNAALEAARGVFVANQDDDDWSHPERIERQVRPLLEDPSIPSSIGWCMRTDERLVAQRPGYAHVFANVSSLLFRRDLALAVGGFIPTRRASDTELMMRLDRYAEQPHVEIRLPLSVMRVRAGSLSSPDFAPGWNHPARVAYKDAYRHWHANTQPKNLVIGSTPTQAQAPVPVPVRFQVTPAAPRRFDVVLAGDWRFLGGPQRSMLEEVAALRAAGRTVGILHLDALRFMSTDDRLLCEPIRALIHAGEVTRVLEDDEDVVELLALRYPPLLQFPPAHPSKLQVERLVVVANQAPSERDGSDLRYVVQDVSAHAEAVFGRRALWVPQGPTVRAAIEDDVAPGELADYDFPGIIDVDEWRSERASFRSDRPVIGRHSRDNAMKWPADRETLLAAYPADGSVEVRAMGGRKAPSEVLGAPTPPTWLVFDADEMPVRTFLNSLDFFVYHQHPEAYDAFGRAVLEALATGLVAILPREMEATFGDAALYATPAETSELVERYYADPELYRAQSELAVRRVEERFSRASYAKQVATILAS